MIMKVGFHTEFDILCHILFSIIVKTNFLRKRGSYSFAEIAVGVFEVFLIELECMLTKKFSDNITLG